MDSAPVRRLATAQFGQADVAIIERKDARYFLASQLAAAMEYSEERALSNLVSGNDELVDGLDYVVLRGAELAAVKAAAPDLVDARAPSLLLLTESGVHLVCLLSRQPAAKKLRRWLAEEVLPSIRRTGRYARRPRRPRKGSIASDEVKAEVVAWLLETGEPARAALPKFGLNCDVRTVQLWVQHHRVTVSPAVASRSRNPALGTARNRDTTAAVPLEHKHEVLMACVREVLVELGLVTRRLATLEAVTEKAGGYAHA